MSDLENVLFTSVVNHHSEMVSCIKKDFDSCQVCETTFSAHMILRFSDVRNGITPKREINVCASYLGCSLTTGRTTLFQSKFS